jgi:hypothetical protein
MTSTPAPPATRPTVFIIPPEETDRKAPPFANEVRVIGVPDAMTLHMYYVSATQAYGVPEGPERTGVRRTEKSIVIESEPVARVALPITTAAELALLILRNVANSPEMNAQLREITARIGEVLQRTSKEA